MSAHHAAVGVPFEEGVTFIRGLYCRQIAWTGRQALLIPFRFKVFILIPLTNRVSSRIIESGWDFPHVHIALSNLEVMIMDTIREYDAKLDSKKRITLRGKPFDYYHVAELEDGRIILEPRELAIPFEVSQKTLAMMDEAVANLKKGTVSETIDLSEFDD